MVSSGNLRFDEGFNLAIDGFVLSGSKCKVVWWEVWDLEDLYHCFSPLLLGSAMVAMFVTPLWCNEELFVVKSSEVLIMMVSKLAQAGAAALDTKSTASPDVSWFPLQAPSTASCVTVDNETCLFHVLILSVPKESAFLFYFPLESTKGK